MDEDACLNFRGIAIAVHARKPNKLSVLMPDNVAGRHLTPCLQHSVVQPGLHRVAISRLADARESPNLADLLRRKPGWYHHAIVVSRHAIPVSYTHLRAHETRHD